MFRTGGSALTAASIATASGGEDSVTAFAGGGQASATALSSTVTHHRVTTVATAGDSVKLPAATVGQEHFVRNDGAAAMQVFGQATETINGVASATGISQAPGMGVWYQCTTAGAWTSSPVTTIALNAANSTSAPAVRVGASNVNGIGTGTNGDVILFSGGTVVLYGGGNPTYLPTSVIGWPSSATYGASADTGITRASANSLLFGAGSTATTTSRTEINKAVTAFSNAVAKTVFTLTIPNAAHSASYLIRLTGSIGAGGAIGANEASATNCYVVTLTRTAGVNATAAISAAFGAAATAVAGATTVTCTAALAAVSGAVGATNTIDIQATISRGGGSSDNHTCVATASLLNANATGITIA